MAYLPPPSISILWVQSNVQYSSMAVLAFDYLLTFGDELEYIWKERWRTGTFLYFFCRYAILSNTMFALFDVADLWGDRWLPLSISRDAADLTELSCRIGYIICGLLSVFGRIGILAVWGLRTYAIYGQSRRMLALLSSLAIACLVCDITQIPFSQCYGKSKLGELKVVANCLVLGFVLITSLLAAAHVWKSFRQSTSLYSTMGRRKSLESIVFCQGTLYLVAVLVFYTSALCLNFKAFHVRDKHVAALNAKLIEHTPGCYEVLHSLLNALKLPIPCLLTARFILRLRKWQRHRQEMSHLTWFPMSPLPEAATGMSCTTGGLDVSPTSTLYRLPRISQLSLREMGEDIGPRPSQRYPSIDWFRDYEWDWDRVDRDELEERRKRAIEEMNEGRAEGSSRTSPNELGSHVPDDVERCIFGSILGSLGDRDPRHSPQSKQACPE